MDDPGLFTGSTSGSLLIDGNLPDKIVVLLTAAIFGVSVLIFGADVSGQAFRSTLGVRTCPRTLRVRLVARSSDAGINWVFSIFILLLVIIFDFKK